MKRSAFTLMELIIVMVVAGILAAVMIPRLERDNLREAANQVVRHIQYTQHLAMMNDVYDAGNDDWYKNRWSIDLCDTDYKIERATDVVADQESAQDPLTQRAINGTDNNLADQGVSSIGLNGTATDCKVVFDNLGRPYRMAGAPGSPAAGLITADAVITLNTSAGRSATINITKQTGYVELTDLN